MKKIFDGKKFRAEVSCLVCGSQFLMGPADIKDIQWKKLTPTSRLEYSTPDLSSIDNWMPYIECPDCNSEIDLSDCLPDNIKRLSFKNNFKERNFGE